jgi:hypothetical protein
MSCDLPLFVRSIPARYYEKITRVCPFEATALSDLPISLLFLLPHFEIERFDGVRTQKIFK